MLGNVQSKSCHILSIAAPWFAGLVDVSAQVPPDRKVVARISWIVHLWASIDMKFDVEVAAGRVVLLVIRHAELYYAVHLVSGSLGVS